MLPWIGPKRPPNLTQRVVAVVLLACALTGLLSAGVSAWWMQDVHNRQLNDSLQVTVQQHEGSLREIIDEAPMDSIVLVRKGGYTQMALDDHAGKGFSTDEAEDRKTLLPYLDKPSGFYDVQLSGGDDARIVVHQAGDSSSVLASSSEPLERTGAMLLLVQVITALASTALAAGVGVWVASTFSRPVQQVAQRASRLSKVPPQELEEVLDLRFEPVEGELEEVVFLKEAMNSLLQTTAVAMEHRVRSEMAMRDFLADVSHDLRTPIAVIRSHADISDRGLKAYDGLVEKYWDRSALTPFDRPDPGRSTQFVNEVWALSPLGQQIMSSVERLAQESRRMGLMVDDLLTLARLGSSSRPEPQEVDVTFTVLELVADARTLTPTHRWAMQVPEEPVMITSDESGVRRVLQNLISNAGKHTPAGTRVEVSLVEENGFAVITVRDDGPGMPGHVMSDGERFSNRDRDNLDSTGLGLTITMGLAKQLGGEVSFLPAERGTCAVVRLPIEFTPGEAGAGIDEMRRVHRRGTDR